MFIYGLCWVCLRRQVVTKMRLARISGSGMAAVESELPLSSLSLCRELGSELCRKMGSWRPTAKHNFFSLRWVLGKHMD